MPRPRQSEERSAGPGRLRATFARSALHQVAALGCCLVSVFALTSCNRSAVEDREERLTKESPSPSSAIRASQRAAAQSREVYATWYDVPLHSLAKRRAGLDELTAAHNKLPLGTLVRVTHLKNGKTVTVRITDRGIPSRKVKLDVCKEAAEELEIVSKGIARVRMEILSDAHGSAPPEAHTSAPQP